MRQEFLAFDTFNLDALIERAIGLLRLHEPRDGEYYGCFSGGKDSVAIKELARLAGVRVSWHYNVTTIDPPELVRFIKREHSDVKFERPKHGNFFHRMETTGFPTRRNRWCCREYKETASPIGAILIFGIRAEESKRRAAAWKDLTHIRRGGWAVSPILQWREDHVWDFIRGRDLPYCKLYDEGFDRLGCIGCPMSRAGRLKQFERWPRFEANWRRAFQRIWDKRAHKKQRDGREWFGSARFKSCEELWQWWLSDGPVPPDEGEESCQMHLDAWS